MVDQNRKKTTRQIIEESNKATDRAEDDYNPLLDSEEHDDEEEGHLKYSARQPNKRSSALPSSESIALPVFGIKSNKKKPVTKGFANNPLPNPVRDRVNDLSDLVDSIEEAGVAGFEDGDAIEDLLDSEEGDSLDDLFPDDSDLEELIGDEDYDEVWHATEDEEEDDDPLEGFNLDEVLADAIEQGASDVHVQPYDHVSFTVLGDIKRQPQFGIVSGEVIQRVQLAIISNQLEDEFVQNFELDTSYTLRTTEHKGRRTRLNIGKTFSDVYLTFRIISNVIPTPEELGIEQEIINWSELPNGLVLVNGPTGTGKTTLLASLIRHIQLTRHEKIITVEKPIEFIYGNVGKALIQQREVPGDTRNFTKALTSAMRGAPDRLLIGEVRDQEEVDAILFASETGHWAVSTIHASSAPTAINRIKSLYEGPELLRVLGSLADNLRGMVNQVLVLTPDGKGRFGVREVLPVTREVSSMVRAGDTEAMRDYQMERKITMEHQLVRAVRAGKAKPKDARSKAMFPEYFDELLAGPRFE